MLILKQTDIEQVFTMAEAIQANKDALARYSAGEATVPLRSNVAISAYNGQILCMPGYVASESAALGVKIVAVYPDNIDKGLPVVPASMLVISPETGILEAVIDGTYLTQLRTGAVQGAGTDVLARKDARIGALIGTGGQAMMQLAAMLEVRNFEEIRIYDRNIEAAKSFAEKMQAHFNPHFDTTLLTVDSAKAAVTDSDVITTVTTSRKPTFDFNNIKKGAHINGVGAYTPEMCEIPHECVIGASRIIFDTTKGVMAEAGDFIQPLEKGLVTEADYHGELGQVLNGDIVGRENDEQITIFKTVGSAVLDVMTAQRILSKSYGKGIGTEVPLF